MQTTALPLPQAPLAQVSPRVQASPSSQGLAVSLWTQPPTGLQLSMVQGLASSQAVAAPGRQLPPAHKSAWVQALLSSQVAELGSATQPVLASQLSSVHGLPSLQASFWPDAQLPSWQRSPLVQASPSLHARLLALNWQPILLSQLSVVQGLPSSQALASPGRQVPERQVSPLVQALPSLHAVPFSWGTNAQTPPLQAAAWQTPMGQVLALTHSGGGAASGTSVGRASPLPVSPSGWTSPALSRMSA